jgi:hypothetical protein
MASIDELVIADDPERWSALGFTVGDGRCQLGRVRLRFVDRARQRGIVGWSLRDLESVELDGLATVRSHDPAVGDPPRHPNRIAAIDHVVAMSPLLDRAVAALQAAGLDLRRVREEPTPAGAPRQAFFRVGAEILEVVQEPHDVVEQAGGSHRPTRFWGLALLSHDIDGTCEQLAGHVGSIRPALQPGRRIATLKHSAGLAVPIAIISPSGAQAQG